jgi:acyl carrier protein
MIVSEIADRVRTFMARDLRIKDAETLGSDVALIKRGVLDSIELMQLVEFLERSYGIRVEDTDILPDNLGSFDSIEGFVARKTAGRAAAAR